VSELELSGPCAVGSHDECADAIDCACGCHPFVDISECWICHRDLAPELTEMRERIDELCPGHRTAFEAAVRSFRERRLSR
jgi:hypothetical protein